MKITYKGDYAIKAVLDLALQNGNLVTIHDMAKRIDVPIKFLEQVLLDLKRGGFVESRRGKIGGYLLSKAPSQIKLGEVIRFIDGPIEPIACIANKYTGCPDLSRCVLRRVWQKAAVAVSGIVDNVSFEDLADQARSKKQALMYAI